MKEYLMHNDLNHVLKMQQIALIEADHRDEPEERRESAERAEQYGRKLRDLREDLGTHQY